MSVIDQDAAFPRVLAALDRLGRRYTEQRPGDVMAQCPAHEDGRPSLHVSDLSGHAVFYCFAGCEQDAILDALGLTRADLFDNRRDTAYDYTDLTGRLTRRVHRTVDKRFSQSGPKDRVILYRLRAVVDAVAARTPVYLVEGEKDVHAIENAGGVATTAPQGATNFGKADVTPLRGATVIAVVDRDQAGHKWAERVRQRLTGVVGSLSFAQAAHGKDAADHLMAGGTLDDLEPYDLEPDEPEPADAVHSGQVRIAYRLADAYSGRLLHVHNMGWHAWDGRRWAEDRHGTAKQAVIKIIRDALAESFNDPKLRKDIQRCESAAGINGVLDIAAALPAFAHTVDQLDADPYLANMANGTLDLRTLQLHDHNPADKITKITTGAYRPDRPTDDTWTASLARILPDDQVRAFAQRLAGLGLLGLVTEQILAIFTGTGANGKTRMYEAINHALGDYAMIAEPDLFLHRDQSHPTGEMDLRGARWVVVSETDDGRRLATATVKRLTGGDPIKARRMRRDFVTFTPSHLPIMVTNHLPKAPADDPALWRRLRVVPFDVVIPTDEQDPRLGERLQLQADAILTWAVDGYRDYADHGLAEPDTVRVATDRYQADSDAIRRFIADECLTGSQLYLTTAEAFARFTAWAKTTGTEPMSLKAFGHALDRLGYPAQKTTNGRRLRRGIGLAAEEDTDE